MVPGTIWISAWTLLLLCLLTPSSGSVLLREGEKCGTFVDGNCEPDLLCLSDKPQDYQSLIAEGVCTRVPTCNCSEFQCPPHRRGDCRRTIVTDPCGCCSHCSRQKGQVCGGPSWRYGYCEDGLICTLVVGMNSARVPQLGVCKEVPRHISKDFSEIQCPIKSGCNVHVGNCDCYSEQSCHAIFSYSKVEDCRRDLSDEVMFYITGNLPKRDSPAYVCKEWRCEVQGCQCVCQEKPCDFKAPLLTETDCCKILKDSGCQNASCPEIPALSCPEDSFISEPYTAAGQCCPEVPAMCTCNFNTCAPKPAYCPVGELPKVVVKGTGQPGTCCDRYECAKMEE